MIREYVLNKDTNLKFEFLDSVDSTNTLAKLRAKEGADEGYIVIASHQTAGRGRLGRSFSSPDGTGIYMSIILKPALSPEKTVLITTAAAVAVSQAIEELSGKQTQIKWVNDILINGKKVCGILTEGSIDPQSKNLDFAVLGIGINVFRPKNDFCDEIKDIAGAVFDKYNEEIKTNLILKIIENFFYYYKVIEEKTFFDYYKEKCFVIGKKVNIIKNGKIISNGEVLDLTRDFSLMIRKESGETEKLSSGEISIRTI
ncbi:MAG: biotin--[Clostridia bacterium]|nr:biotin--[acetyl-CoA-carboxylase] ligase [Clostridia bacterium]